MPLFKPALPRSGLRELQRAHSEALVALSSAENQLYACIERVKEARTTIGHDELVLKELWEAMIEIISSKVIVAREYQGVKKSLAEVRAGLIQRRQTLEGARTAVDQAENTRDELLATVANLKIKLQQTNVVIPWIKWKNFEKR